MKKQKGGTKIEDKQKNKSKRNSWNYSYSPSYHNSTKLLVPRNGTNVEERINIENNLNLVYNIDYVI